MSEHGPLRRTRLLIGPPSRVSRGERQECRRQPEVADRAPRRPNGVGRCADQIDPPAALVEDHEVVSVDADGGVRDAGTASVWLCGDGRVGRVELAQVCQDEVRAEVGRDADALDAGAALRPDLRDRVRVDRVHRHVLVSGG